MNGVLDHALLEALDPRVGEWLEVLPEAGSTNDEARRRALGGAGHGTAVWALRQTAGRGRRGAEWFADEGSLAFSVVLRPEMPRAWWPRLALVAGLAVAEVLERHGIAAEVKWPNDVLAGGRKLCGILAEAGENHVVIGIGINVNQTALPDQLTQFATSARLACGRTVAREEMLVETRAALLFLAGEAARDFGSVVDALAERCALRGKRVRMRVAGRERTGMVRGFAVDGSILLEDSNGIHPVVQADEVRIEQEGRDE